MAKQSGSETPVATRADHQCFLFSIPVCITVNLDITKSVKLAICFFISKFSYFEILFFIQISTVADGFFLHGRGGIIFRNFGQLGKAKLHEKKKFC